MPSLSNPADAPSRLDFGACGQWRWREPAADGWRRARGNRSLSEVRAVALHVAAISLQSTGCVSARLGNGVSVPEGVLEGDGSVLWWWRPGDPKLPG